MARRRIFKLRLWSRCSRQRTSSDGFRVVDQWLLGATSCRLHPNTDRTYLGPSGLDFGTKLKIFVTRGSAC